MRTLKMTPMALTLALVGCIAPDGDMDLEAIEAAVQSTNALSTNALSTNAMSTNALSTNALSTNALSTNALSTNALSTNALNCLGDPADAKYCRQLMKYIVRCALPAGQSWVNNRLSPSETYYGGVGVAPEWKTGPLSSAKKQLMSGCLAAHINPSGTPVPISVRVPGSAPDEGVGLDTREGCWWGNVFTTSPVLYACHDSDTNTSRSNCAFSGCGVIQPQGSCSGMTDEDGGPMPAFTRCGSSTNVVTTYIGAF